MNKVHYSRLKQKNKKLAEKAWNHGLLENPAMPIQTKVENNDGLFQELKKRSLRKIHLNHIL